MRPITVDTKLLCLIGHPVAQSFSPASHNAVYQELGWDYHYLPVEVPKRELLKPVINGIRHMNFAGIAVTKPYKLDIMPYLDEIDPLAHKIGACNTVVVRENGYLKGYNTDGIGAIRSMQEEAGVAYEGKTFFSFGAGGTARALCFEIASRRPTRIYISSRSPLCEELAETINRTFPHTCVAIRAAEQAKIRQAVAASDVLMNLSGLGMAAHLEETPIEQSALQPRHICFDATYNPSKTRFLKEAEQVGCRILNGLGMLIYQGTRQIHIWTGKPEPVEQMKRQMQAIVHQIADV